ncbi:expressed unknown protein [Seminavis robusta]|uniref:PARP catalytic domain-containing protein n=1 Tax=Seminavis robusta TaxID=568900 RepID=A0A9N8HSL8_9STRA|nr:expressed unknown protein [Seminavis robusta]|eukprot:Sro1460_g274620.1 n/a (346) ;mRNA; f:12511-13632
MSVPECEMTPLAFPPRKLVQMAGLSDYRTCWMESSLDAFLDSSTDEMLRQFTLACQSQSFAERCAFLGYPEVIFHPNHYWKRNAMRRGSGFHKFSSALDEAKKGNQKQRLGLVFHGTPTDNIASILQDGLDENRRMGQHYGPGEYFARLPGHAEHYTRGGLEIMVFVVILPPVKTPEEEEEEDGKKRRKCPSDYVVIENNNHHIAIGTLQFQSAKAVVSRPSLSRGYHKRRCAGLNKQIEQTEPGRKRERCCKGTIIQELLIDSPVVAATLYKKWRDPMGLEEAMNRRQRTLSAAAEPNPEQLEHLRCPPGILHTPPNSQPQPIATYITSAGQRAFRVSSSHGIA